MHMPLSPWVHLLVLKLIYNNTQCDESRNELWMIRCGQVKPKFILSDYTYQVEMEDKVTVAKAINSWSLLERLPQSILLIGPSHTGRTTFAQLVRKYIHGSPSAGLAYDNGKYNLEGVISSKSIKIQTAYPALYEKSRKDDKQVKLVDVPSFIYPPENKKWSALEQKLTVDLLVAHSNKVGFLLFIEEKSTRTNIIPWKKALLGFLDLFKPESLTDELLDSVALVITKTPPEIKDESIMVARLKQMKQTLEKDKYAQLNALDRLFKNIIEKNRIIVFRKVTGDESEKEAIVGNWGQLDQLTNYTINKDHLKEQTWQPEGEKSIIQYFTIVQTALRYLATVTNEIFSLPELTADRLREAKRNRPELPQDIAISEQVKSKLTTKQKSIKYFPFIERYIKVSKQYSEVTPENLNKLLQEIGGLGIFSDPEDQLPFQIALEGLEFRSIEDFKQFDLDQHCKAFADLFSEKARTDVLKKLALADSGNERKEFYEGATEMIKSSFQAVPAALNDLLEGFNKALIKFANPKQALALYAKELAQQKNKVKQYSLASDVAAILVNKELFFEAGQAYRSGRNANLALKNLQKAAETDQRAAKEYISCLAELNLFEKAILACYEMADRFGYQSRSTFSNSLKEVETLRSKYLKEGTKTNAFADVDTEAVRKIANQSRQKL